MDITLKILSEHIKKICNLKYKDVLACLCTQCTKHTVDTLRLHMLRAGSERQLKNDLTEELLSDHNSTSFTAVNEKQKQMCVVI